MRTRGEVRSRGRPGLLRWALSTAAGVAGGLLAADAVRDLRSPRPAPAPDTPAGPAPWRKEPPHPVTVAHPAPPVAPPLAERFAGLFPNAFALVMATGIVSIDALRLGWGWIGWALFAINMGAWLLFWIAGLLRVARNPRSIPRDLASHAKGPGFLTLIAGTAILGNQFGAFHLSDGVVLALFALSAALWWIIQYGFIAGVTEGRVKPSLESGFSGQWLLLVVATQALASLGADVLGERGGIPGLAFICYAWVLAGGAFYVLLGATVLYRFAFVEMPPDDLTGPWWINEGAASITVLAGGKLMVIPGLMIGAFPLRDLLSPVLVVFWADATFWIPILVVLFAWKYVIRRRKIGYSVSIWSVVFPLGMYCAASLELASAYGLGFLHIVAHGFFWVAFLAWCATFAGALLAAARAFRG